MTRNSVLIVDDEPEIVAALESELAASGFLVETATDAARALRLLERDPPGAVILDISLPRSMAPGGAIEDGIGLLKRIRRDSDVPVLMLSSTHAETVKILALQLGADDYVTKPYSAAEVTARVKAVLRRKSPSGSANQLLLGEVRVDLASHTVSKGGRPVELTLTELRILEALAQARGRVLSRRQLLDHARGSGHFGDERAVDVHVRHLRKKLEDEPGSPRLILTVRGVGYRLGVVPKEDPASP